MVTKGKSPRVVCAQAPAGAKTTSTATRISAAIRQPRCVWFPAGGGDCYAFLRW